MKIVLGDFKFFGYLIYVWVFLFLNYYEEVRRCEHTFKFMFVVLKQYRNFLSILLDSFL